MMELRTDICPICHGANSCCVKEPESCWCMHVKVPQALIEQLPAELQGQQCICRSCMMAFLEENERHV